MSRIATAPLNIEALHVRRSRNFSLSVASLSLSAGQVVCVAGANGSGKTTLVEAIVGLIAPEPPAVQILGATLEPFSAAAKRSVGYVPDDEAWIVAELTAREYFNLLESLYRRAGVTTDMAAAVSHLAKRLIFTAFDQQLGSLSHGNKKKVQLIAGLMHQPPLVVVDELRNGLDPIAIKQAEAVLRDCAAAGTAIVAATHDLWWAERFADEIVMLQAGRVVLHRATADIVREAGSVEAKFMEIYEPGL